MPATRFALFVLVVCLALTDVRPVYAQEEAAERSGGIEELVVRARKRAELIQDTPVAVTALSDEVLLESNVQRIDDIQKLVPNLTFGTGGNNQAVQITLRGVGTTGGTGVAFDPGVGLYIDGVFLPRSQVSVFDALEIRQVEVLRGPQGTLFGKNTVGGAISITTQKPNDELSGSIFLRPGNYNAIRTRAVLNIPIDRGWFEDKLFTRFALATRNRDGVVFNETHDEYWGEESGISFLGSIRLIPRDDITLDISGTWFRDQTHGTASHCFMIQPDAPLATILGPDFLDACRRTRPRRISADTNQVASGSSWGVWGTLAWDLGGFGPVEDATLKLIGSWREQLSPSRTDLDATDVLTADGEPSAKLANFGGPPGEGQAGEAEQIQQELQLNGVALDGRLNMVAGLFGFWENANRHNGLDLPFVGTLSENQVFTDNWTWALYGQATFEATEWMSLTAGLRYTEDKKAAGQVNRNFNLLPADPVTASVFDKEIFSSWTPMGSIALFAPDFILEPAGLEHLMTYFTYARGFKGGGLNAVLAAAAEEGLVSFDPEVLDNFEVGVKAIAFDRRLTLNLAFFESRYDDIQRGVIRSSVEIDETGEETLRFNNLTLNAAEATMRGIEVEGVAMPIPGLQLTGSFGFIDARYDSFGEGCDQLDSSDILLDCPASQLDNRNIDRSGERFLRTPEYTSFVSAQYTIPVALEGWMAGGLTPRFEWSYRGSELFAPPEISAGTQPSYHLFNARLSYLFLDDQAEVALWGLNLSDETYYSTFSSATVNTFGHAVAGYGLPLTYGAEVSYRF